MKKIILILLLAATMIIPGSVMPFRTDLTAWIEDHIDLKPGTVILPGWAMPESMKPTPKPTYPQGSNSETIESLVERMRINKETNTVERLTDRSTVVDAVDRIGAGNIDGAVVSYNCELLGYPPVVKCQFSNNGDGMLPLKVMSFYIYPIDQLKGKGEQVEELAAKFDGEMGSRLSEGTADYSWGSGAHYVFLNASIKALIPPRAIASVIAMSGDSEIPDIFPFKFGIDIKTVYQNNIPGSMQEDLNDPYLYYLYYKDAETYIDLSFKVQDSEIKLCKAEYEVRLLDTGNEDINKCFKSFGDSMEEILGSAVSRDDSPSVSISFMENPPQKIYKPALRLNWPGLEIVASYEMNEDPIIYIDFSEKYFTEK